MKNKILTIVLILISLRLSAQDTIPDSLIQIKPFYSFTNLRPINISKGNFLFTFDAGFPKFHKVFDQKTSSMEKASDKVVYNEMNLNLNAIYGISSKLNLIAEIPFLDYHFITPMMYFKGIGLGDIRIGVNYNVWSKEKSALSTRIDAGFPTGKSEKLQVGELSRGLGAFMAKASVAGYRNIKKSNLVYSAYYEYRLPNSSGVDVADEASLYLFMQKYFDTDYGYWGIEYGLEGNTQINGSNFTKKINADLFLGGYYAYSKDFLIHFSLPYTIYQYDAFLTKYSINVKLDYSINKRNK